MPECVPDDHEIQHSRLTPLLYTPISSFTSKPLIFARESARNVVFHERSTDRIQSRTIKVR